MGELEPTSENIIKTLGTKEKYLLQYDMFWNTHDLFWMPFTGKESQQKVDGLISDCLPTSTVHKTPGESMEELVASI